MASDSVVMTQFTLGAVVVAALQWLKSSKYFPWITKGKVNLLRGISAVAAAAASVGIGHVWDPQAHSLTITGLTLAGIATAFYAWLKQFAVQEFMYRATKNGSSNAAAPAPTAPSLTTVNSKPI
jgi:hypothetical protein